VRVAAIIVRDGNILLARHERKGKSYYVLPGGGVDFGETLPEALVRELREEAGLTVRVGDLVLVNDGIPPDAARHILNLYFLAESDSGEPVVGHADKRLVGLEFLPVDQLSEITLYPDLRAELRGIIDGTWTGLRYLGNLWKDLE